MIYLTIIIIFLLKRPIVVFFMELLSARYGITISEDSTRYYTDNTPKCTWSLSFIYALGSLFTDIHWRINNNVNYNKAFKEAILRKLEK